MCLFPWPDLASGKSCATKTSVTSCLHLIQADLRFNEAFYQVSALNAMWFLFTLWLIQSIQSKSLKFRNSNNLDDTASREP